MENNLVPYEDDSANYQGSHFPSDLLPPDSTRSELDQIDEEAEKKIFAEFAPTITIPSVVKKKYNRRKPISQKIAVVSSVSTVSNISHPLVTNTVHLNKIQDGSHGDCQEEIGDDNYSDYCSSTPSTNTTSSRPNKRRRQHRGRSASASTSSEKSNDITELQARYTQRLKTVSSSDSVADNNGVRIRGVARRSLLPARSTVIENGSDVLRTDIPLVQSTMDTLFLSSNILPIPLPTPSSTPNQSPRYHPTAPSNSSSLKITAETAKAEGIPKRYIGLTHNEMEFVRLRDRERHRLRYHLVIKPSKVSKNSKRGRKPKNEPLYHPNMVLEGAFAVVPND
jgi:hypothetical protein